MLGIRYRCTYIDSCLAGHVGLFCYQQVSYAVVCLALAECDFFYPFEPDRFSSNSQLKFVHVDDESVGNYNLYFSTSIKLIT